MHTESDQVLFSLCYSNTHTLHQGYNSFKADLLVQQQIVFSERSYPFFFSAYHIIYPGRTSNARVKYFNVTGELLVVFMMLWALAAFRRTRMLLRSYAKRPTSRLSTMSSASRDAMKSIMYVKWLVSGHVCAETDRTGSWLISWLLICTLKSQASINFPER